MYAYLQNNPHAGIISGLSSGVLLFFQEMFTNDHVLKIVAGVAAWAGCLVAVCTLIVWLIKVSETIYSKFKKP